MRLFAIATLLGLLLSSAAALPVGDPFTQAPVVDKGRQVHPSITIEGDAQFEGLLSGVRSGSGTADDPYVISGWSFLQSQPHGVLLRGTRAHVVLRDLAFSDTRDAVARATYCTFFIGGCPGAGAAIQLLDAENVTVENVRVGADFGGIHLDGSRAVTIRDSRIGDVTESRPGLALALEGSSDVVVSNVTVPRSVTPLLVFQSSRVLLDRVSIGDPSYPPHIAYSHDVTIRDSQIVSNGNSWWMYGEQSNFTLLRNSITQGGFGGIFDAAPERILLCGNTMQGGRSYASLSLEEANGARIVGNRIEAARTAVYVHGQGITFDANEVTGGDWWGATLGPGTTSATNNSFHDLPGVSIDPQADARHNWWGDASGPSLLGPGTGVRLSNSSAGVLYGPWLVAPPTLNVDCDLEQAPAVLPRIVPVVVSRHEFVGGIGARVLTNAAPGERMEIHAEFQSRGSTINFLVMAEHDDGSYSALGIFISTETVSAEAWGPGLSLEFRPRPDGSGSATTTCLGTSCPRSLVVLLGATDGLDGTLTVARTQAQEPTTVFAAAHAGVVHQRDFQTRGTGVGANVLVNTGAGEASSHTLAFHQGFFGYSENGSSSLQPRAFTVSSDEGTRDAHGRFYLGEPKGLYEFSAEAWQGGSGDAYVLYADLPR